MSPDLVQQLNQAVSLISRRQFSTAEPILRSLVSIKYPPAYAVLAQLLRSRHQWRQAKNIAFTGLELCSATLHQSPWPQNASVGYVNLELEECRNTHTELRLIYAACLTDEGLLDVAKTDLQILHAEYPDRWLITFLLADTLHTLGELEDAYALYQQALLDTPPESEYDIYASLGLLSEDLGERANAAAYYSRAFHNSWLLNRRLALNIFLGLSRTAGCRPGLCLVRDLFRLAQLLFRKPHAPEIAP